MPADSLRVVLDTNVLLRGMLSGVSPSGCILRAAENRSVVIITSRELMREYRAVLLDEEIMSRLPALSVRMVELTLRRLRYVGDYLARPTARFIFPRDPRDEMLIELAIAGRATDIVSVDDDAAFASNQSKRRGKTISAKTARSSNPGTERFRQAPQAMMA